MLTHMHNHNSGTHSVQQEDINMPEWLQQLIEEGQASQGEEINPYQQSYEYTLPGEGGFNPFNIYSYQGLSPDVMSALQNVFDLPLTDEGQVSTEFMPWGADPGMAPISGFGGGGTNPYIFGEESVLPVTDIFDPASLASTLSQIGGMDEAIRPGEVKALTPEMLEKTTSAYYEPYETAERGTLVDKLSKERSKATTGGFAGSVGREAGLSGAEKLYQGGYQDILSDIMKLRGGASENVLDTIYGWQELMSGQ